MTERPGGAWLKPWSSIFLKILAVLLVAAFALSWINAQTVRLAREAEQRTRGSYVRELACDLQSRLGDPPKPAVAWRLARKGTWRVGFVPLKPGGAGWATDPDLPALDVLRSARVGADWGDYRNCFFFLSTRPAGTVVMMTPPRYESLGWKFQSLRLGGAAGVLLAVWLAVAWLLKPVRWLDQGVARVSAGDLGHRVPVRENDELGRLAMQFNDMTEQVQAMLEQRRRLLLDVSHELRTPLTRLRLGLEALPEGETRAGLAEDVGELETLVEELIEGARLARGDGLNRERVDLGALASEVAASFKGREPGLRVEAPEGVVLEADRVRLRRLLRNLLSNAFDHGQPARAPVTLSLRRAGNAAILSVADEGPGVPKEHLKRLFTPFFRGDQSRARATGGVGLGLALCLGVARAHGGDLVADLGPGGGLVFTLTLPLG